MSPIRLGNSILFVFCSLLLIGSFSQPSLEEQLMDIFSRLQAVPTKIVFHQGSRPISDVVLEDSHKKWLQIFPFLNSQEKVTRNGKKIVLVGSNHEISLKVVIVTGQPTKWGRPYIALQMESLTGKVTPVWYKTKAKLGMILNSLHIEPRHHLVMQGALPSSKDLNKPLNVAFKKLRAQHIEGMNTNDTISISGYTPLLTNVNNPPYIITGGRKMNVQVATRYDSLHQCVVLTIGLPIITIEY